MRSHPSDLALSAARWLPFLAKPVLWGWGQYYGRSKKPLHWVFTAMGNIVNYRVPFWATLPNGCKLKVAINDLTGQEICRLGYTEPESVHVISSLVRPGHVFFDLGAHVGQFTLVASKWVGAAGVVHSFEPDVETFSWLCENVKKNKITNVVANQVAVCDRAGYRDFYPGTIEAMQASSLAIPRAPSGRTVRVPTISINEYCSSRGIRSIDFMKIDVEGAEVDVLRGASPFLSGQKKPRIHIEFHPLTQRAFGRSLRDLADVLSGYGYKLFRLCDRGPREFWLDPEEPSVFNVLALSPADAEELVLRQRSK